MPIINISGEKFGRLTVLKLCPERNVGNSKRTYWLCVCHCGVLVSVRGDGLKSGTTQSCGCLRLENLQKAVTKHGCAKDDNQSAEYVTWQNIKQRCENKNKKCYKNYKDIKVCDRWIDSFDNFLKDMGPKPSPKHSIERKDSKKDYSPNNCVWATRKEQNRNHSRNVWVEYEGRRMILTDWAQELGIRFSNLKYHLSNNVPFEIIYTHYKHEGGGKFCPRKNT